MSLEEQVRQAAARGYCHEKNRSKEVDGDLLLAICDEVVKSLTPNDRPHD